MFQETISDEYIVIQSGTSEGSQIKYRKDNYWYKKDNRGHEGRTEYLCSKLLSFSTLEQSEYVEYEQGYINQNMGCRSKNFLNPGEELITFYRLYYNEFGKDLSEVIGQMETMEERIEYVVNFIKQTCLIDITDYLKIPMEDTVAIGDSNNDLPMLKYAHTSIAMGNSSEQVLETADYITTDVDKDGIWNALKWLGVLDK